MGRYIVAIDHDGQRYYIEWSSIVDAPISRGMRLPDFLAHIRAEYGTAGLRDIAERLDRADKHGTSCHSESSVEDLIAGNRAGRDETELTLQQIVDHWILGEPLAAGREHEGDPL